jgi:hypothetical protein
VVVAVEEALVGDFKAVVDFRVGAGSPAVDSPAVDSPAVEVSQVSPAELRLQQFPVVHNLSSWEKFRLQRTPEPTIC